MNLNDPGVDTVVAQLAVNDKPGDDTEGLITDIVAFFEPTQAKPSQNEPDLRRRSRDRVRERQAETPTIMKR